MLLERARRRARVSDSGAARHRLALATATRTAAHRLPGDRPDRPGVSPQRSQPVPRAQCSDFGGYFEQMWNVHFPAGARGSLNLSPRHHLIDVDFRIGTAAAGKLRLTATAWRESASWRGCCRFWFHPGVDRDRYQPVLAGLERGAGPRLLGLPYAVIITRDYDWDWTVLGNGVQICLPRAHHRTGHRSLGLATRRPRAGRSRVLPPVRGAQRRGGRAGGRHTRPGGRRLRGGPDVVGRAGGAASVRSGGGVFVSTSLPCWTPISLRFICRVSRPVHGGYRTSPWRALGAAH